MHEYRIVCSRHLHIVNYPFVSIWCAMFNVFIGGAVKFTATPTLGIDYFYFLECFVNVIADPQFPSRLRSLCFNHP